MTFFEKLVLTHPPTFWPGVDNFSFWSPLAQTVCEESYSYQTAPYQTWQQPQVAIELVIMLLTF